METDDLTECPNAPNGIHQYVFETSAGMSALACRFCRRGADALPPDDRWMGIE